MTRWLGFTLLLASGWSLSDSSLEKLRWNTRERTAAGLESLQRGEAQQAIGALETAARLDPADAQLRFNAGTGHLLAGSEGAMEHLVAAAETAPESLLPAAHFNLGNARFAAGDTAGAIEAFENALRSRPDYDDAKFNLELALELQQQQEEQEQQNEDQDDSSENQQQQQQDPSENEQEQDQGQGEQQQQQQPPESDQGDQEQPLPQFEDQPDMSAEQAAAILEAVENLEREQRRRQAQEEMKKQPRKGKDW